MWTLFRPNTPFLWPTRPTTLNDISIESAVFPQYVFRCAVKISNVAGEVTCRSRPLRVRVAATGNDAVLLSDSLCPVGSFLCHPVGYYEESRDFCADGRAEGGDDNSEETLRGSPRTETSSRVVPALLLDPCDVIATLSADCMNHSRFVAALLLECDKFMCFYCHGG